MDSGLIHGMDLMDAAEDSGHERRGQLVDECAEDRVFLGGLPTVVNGQTASCCGRPCPP